MWENFDQIIEDMKFDISKTNQSEGSYFVTNISAGAQRLLKI